MKLPIIKYKHGEPTIIVRENGTYVNDIEEWNKIIEEIKKTQ